MKVMVFLTAVISSGFMLGLIASPSTAAEVRGKADKYIDISNGNTNDGIGVHLWYCNGSPEQQ